jgi:catechol 2,3-dioxygenase-like lactoylglutathione lyase family enzyme
MEQRLSLITLGVTDLARARRFYEEGLGWQHHFTDGDVAFYQLNGLVFALWGADALAADAGLTAETAGTGRIALAHNVRSREEVDAILAAADAAGGRVLKPGTQAPWDGYSGYFADPDGHIWEVAWNPGFPIDETGNTWLGS